ncbi:AAA family ATPase [Agrobacterium tumefaciens]|uniref:AAA family ATPase n=1 Tax=Agrobacterium tumefaciens TaxID=358 RepID=UPI000E0AA2DC|nr:AAA family ATPase [Agrobacterium tumefaciens]WQE41039.1 AAA family ATPase [Agrobacterium tumefaciens]
MYVRRIEIENNGPIGYINYVFPFDADDKPKPVLFVGQNGAGKSIFLSQIVNALIEAKGAVYQDREVKDGNVYKIRSPAYVRRNSSFSRSYVHFDSDLYLGEIQAIMKKGDFEEQLKMSPADQNWSRMDDDESSCIISNFHQKKSETYKKVSGSAILYFPANRFEEPAWLNAENLINVTDYPSANRIKGISGRKIINDISLKDNQSWLLDVLYDSLALERRVQVMNISGVELQLLQQTNGPSTKLRAAIEVFLKLLFRVDGTITWGVGGRGRRNISVVVDGELIAGNLFSLSTGQTALLNMFLTIVRDYDLTTGSFDALEDIRGIVIIDEVDLHLHTELQHSVLPELIATFSSIQFVLTTHSPLFILGLEKRLGAEGFSLIELPDGKQIGVERFSEFEAAYSHFRASTRFENDMQKAVVESQVPVLMTEGTIDIDYIRRAAEILGRQSSIQKFRLIDGNGFGGLDKVWKLFDLNLAKLSNQKVVLVYDCDITKPSLSKPGVVRITIPQQPNKISKGIENLFADDVIANAMEANPAFIDVTPALQRSVRGTVVTEEEKWEVNVDEKRNLANWIIQNGTLEDFSGFNILFDLIDAAQ